MPSSISCAKDRGRSSKMPHTLAHTSWAINPTFVNRIHKYWLPNTAACNEAQPSIARAFTFKSAKSTESSNRHTVSNREKIATRLPTTFKLERLEIRGK